MSVATREYLGHVLRRLREVQVHLGLEPAGDDPAARLADEVDSMGLVELIAVLAEDCGVRPEVIEKAVGHRFGSVGELAEALASAGLTFHAVEQGACLPSGQAGKMPASGTTCWLSAVTLRLPEAVESAELLDAR